MNKHDIKRNLPTMTGRLGKCGYDRWCHFFTGIHKETGVKKSFFVEYCIVNPELGGKEPVMGDKRYQRPAYLMVRAGMWGKNGYSVKRYYGIEEMEVASTFLKITAGECFLSENNIWGRIQEKHSMRWSLMMNKRVAFNIGYSTSQPVREINPFDMYWHAEGMRTIFEGTITADGQIYQVTAESGYGYADKKWGRDYTGPWFWVYGNQMKSKRTGERLKNSAFAIGGGDPVVLGFQLKNKPFADIYYEGQNREVNFSTPGTFARMKYSCKWKNGDLLWHMKAKSRNTAMEVRIVCPGGEMQVINYQTPEGEWKRDNTLGSGTGKGEILLYQRKGRKYTLIDTIYVKGVGFEYTGKSKKK